MTTSCHQLLAATAVYLLEDSLLYQDCVTTHFLQEEEYPSHFGSMYCYVGKLIVPMHGFSEQYHWVMLMHGAIKGTSFLNSEVHGGSVYQNFFPH